MPQREDESYRIDNPLMEVIITPKNPAGGYAAGIFLVPKIKSLLEGLYSGYFDREQLILTRHNWSPRQVVKQYRTKKNWTQQTLAEASKISPTRISEIESGKVKIGKKTAQRLAHALGCHYLEFL